MGKNPTTPLYSDSKKRQIFFDKTNSIKSVKRAKRSHVYKVYASTYNADISYTFNPELQLRNTESAMKNRLRGLLTELKGFNKVTTLKVMTKQKIAPFILSQRQKQLLMRVILMMYLNQSLARLYQTRKNHLVKVTAGLLIWS